MTFTTEDDFTRQFAAQRARELTAQMAEFNQPGRIVTDVELQEWAGSATAILQMVAETWDLAKPAIQARLSDA